jgi:hypothetical protein
MRFPYPLDNCECGHYRISHDANASQEEVRCNVCKCTSFSLKPSHDERSEVKRQVE